VLVAGGGSAVRFVVDGRIRWTDLLDKKSDVISDHVEVSSDSQLVAISVKRLTGGSRLFDISRHLKSTRVIVYQAKSGTRALEVFADPTPCSSFDFALSPQGDTLAIVSDEFVEIVPLK
jgi:hypothetical protein